MPDMARKKQIYTAARDTLLLCQLAVERLLTDSSAGCTSLRGGW
jgi:hypothetical protein